MTANDLPTVISSLSSFFDDWLAVQLSKTPTPGIQVAIRVGDELAYSRAFGLANAQTGEALTTAHRFRVASHSKTFTATAILVLAEQGKLRLDDTLATWILELDDAPAGQVSLTELLSHRAAIIRNGSSADCWQGLGAFPSWEQTLADLRGDLIFEPNRFFKYSNVGFAALGRVIEVVTGVDFATALDYLVFSKLGRVDVGLGESDGLFTAGHSMPLGELGVRVLPGREQHLDSQDAAAGIWASAEGLTAYFAHHRMGDVTLISDASKRMALHEQSRVTQNGADIGYGLGFVRSKVGEHQLWGHSGGFYGQITDTLFDPDTGLVVSVLTNGLSGPAEELSAGIVRLVDKAQDRAGGDDEYLRLVNEWGDIALVWTTGKPALVSLLESDPAASVVELERIDADHFRQSPVDSFNAPGEVVELVRDESGQFIRAHLEGMSAWPPAEFAKVFDREVPH